MKRSVALFLLFSCLLAASMQAQQALAPLMTLPQKDTIRLETNLKPLLLKPAPVAYDYYNHLGAACKVEFRLEKATSIPFRFRLGSLQQTDYLEQKPNARKPE